MKRSTKFCRCIKTVRKQVGEKGAIGICVHSMLQSKGRTLKKFNCGKNPRLVTQKLKKKGGSVPTWAYASTIAEELQVSQSEEEINQLLDRLHGTVKSLYLPKTLRDKRRWLFISTVFLGVYTGGESELNLAKELVKKRPSGIEFVEFIETAIERLRTNTNNPEYNRLADALEVNVREPPQAGS